MARGGDGTQEKGAGERRRKQGRNVESREESRKQGGEWEAGRGVRSGEGSRKGREGSKKNGEESRERGGMWETGGK